MKHDDPGLTQYFFMHLPKTAGTSFRHMLWSHFSQSEVVPNHEDLAANGGHYLRLPELLELRQNRLRTCRLLCGHLPAVARELFEKPPAMLVWLRDPVRRAISNLHHVRRRDMPTRTLAEVFDRADLRTMCVTNRQTRMLSFRSLDEAIAQQDTLIPDRGRLALAKETLSSALFVGITEEFEASIDLCEDTLGWRFPGGNLRVNVSPSIEDDLEALVPRVRAEVDLDVELYRHARELLRARLDRMRTRHPREEAPHVEEGSR